MSTTAELSRWLLKVTRPVLKPLGASVGFRHLDQVTGLAMLGLGAGAVARLIASKAGLTEGDARWLPGSIAGLVITLVVLSLLKGLARYLEQFFGHLVAFKALELLRVQLYRALTPQAPMVLQRATSGDLLVRATKDIDRVEVFFAHTFPPAVTAITIPLLAVLGVGGWVSWPVAGALAAGLAVSAVLLPLLGFVRTQQAAGQSAWLRGRLGQHVTDSMQGMAEITGYGHTGRRLDEMTALDDQIGAAQRSRGNLQAVRAGSQTVVRAATTLAVTLVGLAGDLGIVPLAIVVALSWKLFDTTAAVTDFMSGLDASLAAAARVHEIIVAAPTVSDPALPARMPDGPLSVVWRRVSYQYPGGNAGREPALSDVSIEVPAGSHCCLAGVSGCGKSTLLSLAVRFDDPTSGAVLVGGIDTRDLELDELRSRVALVTQATFLIHGTISENLRLADPAAPDDRLWQVLQIAQLDAEIREMPDGLATQVGEQGQQISGGQRQRLALARALLSDADVFLLDEFTAHLDPPLAARVRASLRTARPRATIIESTHDLQGIDQADQVIALDHGRLAPQALNRLLDR